MPPPSNRSESIPWPDLIAGLSLAGLLLPEAVAYSSIARLGPQAGIIGLFAGLICYGLIGRSRFAIVSATSSSAAVLAAATGSVAAGDPGIRLAMAGALVMLTGLFFLFAGAARIGSVTDFIAKPVLRGFAFGLAIVIVLRQVADVVHVRTAGTNLFRLLTDLLRHLPDWNWPGALLATAALLLLAALARLPRVPAGLLVILLGIAVGHWLDLQRYGITLVGTIDLRPAAPDWPELSYADWLRSGELAIALVLILYAESYGSIQSFALKHGDRVAPDRDLLALGAANLVSGLLQGMPVGAGYSATSANEAAGARSRLAGWWAALVLAVVAVALLPLVALTPTPVLAAIVIHAVGHTLRPAVFRPYFALHRDRLVVLAAVLAVLLLGVLDGLLAAIAVSLVMLLRRMAESSVTALGRYGNGHDFVSLAQHADARPEPGMLILRPETPLFFANAERVLNEARSRLSAAGGDVHTLILSLEESPDLDSSSVEALRTFCAAVLAQDKRLLFARLKGPAQRVLSRAAIAGLPIEALSDLSVDETVNLARQERESASLRTGG